MTISGSTLKYDKEARAKLAEGAEDLTRAVVATLGPRSKNVAIDKNFPDAPHVVHDGVTIAKAIFYKDRFKNMGAQLLKQAASRTNDLVGDGTTTATLVANVLIQEGLKRVEGGVVDGIIVPVTSAMELREELFRLEKLVLEELDNIKIAVTTEEQTLQIATISAQDEEIGRLVAQAIKEVGKDGTVVVEEGSSFDSTMQVQEGMEFDNGYLSPFLVTDSDKMITEYQDVYILICDHVIADPMTVVPIITKVMAEDKALLIIAGDVVRPALDAICATKVDARTHAKVVAVMAPEFGDRRPQMLEDIAILTGGTFFAQGAGMKLGEDVKLGQLGRAKKIRVSQTHTTIVPKDPDSDEIQDRVAVIKEQIDAEPNSFKKQKLEERMTKLSGKLAVISVGGANKTAVEEKYERYIDAISACKAAVDDGVVSGGGVALLSIAYKLFDKKDPTVAEELMFAALTAPFSMILKNSGVTDEDKIIPAVGGVTGYDVVNKKVVNMVEAGIVDPVKVTKLVVTNAVSVAGMVFTNEVLISYDEDEVQKVRPVS